MFDPFFNANSTNSRRLSLISATFQGIPKLLSCERRQNTSQVSPMSPYTCYLCLQSIHPSRGRELRIHRLAVFFNWLSGHRHRMPQPDQPKSDTVLPTCQTIGELLLAHAQETP